MYGFTYFLFPLASVCSRAASTEVVPGKGLPSLVELGLTSAQLFALGRRNGEFCDGIARQQGFAEQGLTWYK